MSELRYHHVGIPTDRPLPKEDYIEQFKVYASGYFQSPYGVEWMKFEPGCDLPELVKTVPHVAFVLMTFELLSRARNTYGAELSSGGCYGRLHGRQRCANRVSSV